MAHTQLLWAQVELATHRGIKVPIVAEQREYLRHSTGYHALVVVLHGTEVQHRILITPIARLERTALAVPVTVPELLAGLALHRHFQAH
jgi:hypothetical protein